MENVKHLFLTIVNTLISNIKLFGTYIAHQYQIKKLKMDILGMYKHLKNKAKHLMIEGRINEYLKTLKEIDKLQVQLIKVN